MTVITKTHYTVTEAAEILGVSPQRVRQLIAEDRLKANQVHPRLWIIHRSTLEKFKEEERPVGVHIDRR